MRPRGQFHQHSMRSFCICKLCEQLFCAYTLGLYFTGISLPAQKLLIEHSADFKLNLTAYRANSVDHKSWEKLQVLHTGIIGHNSVEEIEQLL